ncbi:MAG: lipoprotein [Pseudomonadota bacterium]|nr:lipoprotein [Pseudomonadota bacterium]
MIWRSTPIFLFALWILVGCGQKGDLYFPDEPREDPAAQTQRTN